MPLYRFPLLVFILSKILVFGWAFALPRIGMGDISWTNWDANIYIEIVNHGYTFRGLPVSDVSTKDSIAFFPLYPFAVRYFSKITRIPPIPSGLILSSLFTLLAALLIYDLALKWRNEKVAKLATFFFLFAPGSIFFSAVYTESLFVFLTVLCLRAIFLENWYVAGLSLGLASITRIPGVALFPALGIALLQKKPGLQKTAKVIGLSLLPLILFLIYQHFAFGTPFAFLEAQQTGWSRKLDWPWTGIIALITNIPRYNVFIGDLVVFLFMLVVSAIGFRRLPLSFSVYSFGILALAICTNWPMSVTRICLIALPYYLVIADLTATHTALWVGYALTTLTWSQVGNVYYLLRRLFL